MRFSARLTWHSAADHARPLQCRVRRRFRSQSYRDMPGVLLVSEPPGDLDGRRIRFKCLIQEHLAFVEHAPDNSARRGRCPAATAVQGMSKKAGISRLITPGSVAG